MKRELKFRCWNGKMIDLHSITPLAIGDLKQDGVFIPFMEGCHIMQYTGLKDKNGKEIYEGDVVFMKLKESHKWQSGYWEYPTGNLIITGDYFMDKKCVVGFQNGCFGLISEEVFHAFENFDHWETEVIGNIYETPSLLTNQVK
jgi:uncharacterized phage protein (TIGR01671 family)